MRISELYNLPKDLKAFIKWIGRQADHYGFRAFIVGGFVRDILLNKQSLDFDVVVEGSGIEFAKRLAEDKAGSLIKHRQFGTATVIMPDKLKVDIATARKEIYEKPAVLPKVTPGSIKDDLFRRDFSINAMAININKDNFGQLIDYFNGRRDLKERKIRILHDLSFIDDPTRILRAIRFEQRFNFRLERHTYSLMKKALKQNLLNKVSPHRIWDELVLLLKESEPKKYISRLNKICGLDFIHPKIRFDKNCLKSFDFVAQNIHWFYQRFPHRRQIDTWLVYFILLLDRLKIKDIDYIVKKYNITKGDQRRIYSFVQLRRSLFRYLDRPKLKPSQIFSILEPLSYEVIILIKSTAAKKIIKQRIEEFLSSYNGARLYIRGRDLVELGIKPSKHFTDILKKTLYAKIDGKLESKSDELNFVKRLMEKR